MPVSLSSAHEVLGGQEGDHFSQSPLVSCKNLHQEIIFSALPKTIPGNDSAIFFSPRNCPFVTSLLLREGHEVYTGQPPLPASALPPTVLSEPLPGPVLWRFPLSPLLQASGRANTLFAIASTKMSFQTPWEARHSLSLLRLQTLQELGGNVLAGLLPSPEPGWAKGLFLSLPHRHTGLYTQIMPWKLCALSGLFTWPQKKKITAPSPSVRPTVLADPSYQSGPLL